MPNIQINIKNKVARADKAIIVCDNSDYTAVFDFDDEWSAYDTKTARFVYGGRYTDVVFSGNECAVPVMQDTRAVTVGVFAGDLHTTTPAYFACVPSILCGNGIPADPTPDVYAQIMELLNKESGIWYPAVDDAGNMSWTRSISETEPQPVNIKGPKGDVGAQGETGPQGPKGDTGATGPQGPKGDVGADGTNGNDGVSPTVSVAAITGGNRVTITDAEGAKTFDVMDGAQGASGADGKDYVLTDADKQEIAETAAGLVDVPSVQSDWNQNDSTQPDYVKNRPFYTGDPVETVLVEESTVSFSFSEDNGGIYLGKLSSTFSPTIGETYKVSWDGTVYECVCASMQGVGVIGNASFIGAGSDTGEPFIMVVNNGVGIRIAAADTSASHTFSISGFVEPIVKIPAKFIDKDASGYIVVHKNSTMTKQEAQNYDSSILAGEVVFIIWSWIYIKGISLSGANDESLLIETQNGESYLIAQNSEGLFNLNDIKLHKAAFPSKHMTGDVFSKIDIVNGKIRISSSSISSGVGTTDVLFYVQPNGTKSKAFNVLGNGEAVAPALILYSSTSGSTKKFKITVDDSGVITATEVT